MSYWERRRKQPIWLQKWSLCTKHNDLHSVFAETRHYAIVRMEGHSYTTKIGRFYSPVTYRLADKNGHATDILAVSHEGRMTPVARESLMRELQEAEASYRPFVNPPNMTGLRGFRS